MNTETMYGITYSKPVVTLLNDNGLGVAEIAGRTAYDSFSNSENECIVDFNRSMDLDAVNNIESSNLLGDLAWTYFHHSVLEHVALNYYIQGTSRGVLQELVRHRIASYTVRSTRYTMQGVLHAFNACSVSLLSQAKANFVDLIRPMNLFVVKGTPETIEIEAMYDKLLYQMTTIGKEAFADLTLGKDAKKVFENRRDYDTTKELFEALKECKSKRNVGDAFKGHIVSDCWKVDMVVTFNLRSLKNYFTLRYSDSAWWQIKILAEEMIKATPHKYIKLIMKEDKIKKIISNNSKE